MNRSEALTALGMTVEADERELRLRFHELMRVHHPDVADAEHATLSPRVDAAVLTEAYAVALQSLTDNKSARAEPDVGHEAGSRSINHGKDLRATHDGDTISIEAPSDEAYQLLYESASQLGGIGHVDRGLGLLEVIVRFDGGPSCSVLMTFQGRAHGTDVFCEMESIEAAPTPPIDTVLDALVEALHSSTSPSAT